MPASTDARWPPTRPVVQTFTRPGFELDEGPFRLASHRLDELLDDHERAGIDARPRILPRQDGPLRPAQRLADLEHARMAQQLLPQVAGQNERDRARGLAAAPLLNAASHWARPQAWLTGVLPQYQRFREQTRPETDLVLLPNEDEDGYELHRLADGERRGEKHYVKIEGLHHAVADAAVQGEGIAPWGEVDFMQVLAEHAQAFDLSLHACARRMATVSVPDSEQGWRFHPLLGFVGKD